MSLSSTETSLREAKSFESDASSSSSSSVPTTYPIIVHNLDASVEESLLYDHFKMVGPVISALVVRKFKISLGYGYVNFRYEKDALCAVQKLDHTAIKDNIVRVGPSKNMHLEQSSRKPKIYVYNIEPSVTKIQFEELFSGFGEISASKMFKDETISYGYIIYKRLNSVERVLSDMNGKFFRGQSIKVATEDNLIGTIKSESKERAFSSVIVQGFSSTTTKHQLKVLLGSCGTIISCDIFEDLPVTGHVVFKTSLQAKSAVISYDKFQLNGSTLSVELGCDSSYKIPTYLKTQKDDNNQLSQNNLYVCNFSKTVKETQLRSLFCAYGEILSVKILRSLNNESRGCGFIKFALPDNASKALALNGRFFGDRALTVRYHTRKPSDSQSSPKKGVPLETSPLAKDQFEADTNSIDSNINATLKKQTSSPSPLKRFVSSIVSSSPKVQEEMVRDYMAFKIKERLIQYTDVLTDMFFDNDLPVLLELIQDEQDLNSSIDKAILLLIQHVDDNKKS